MDAVAKLLLAARHPADSALACGPVARRRIEQRLLEAAARQRSADVVRGVLVREEELDAAEAAPRRRPEAFQEGKLGEEEAEVGGELHHRKQAEIVLESS
eukprot:5400484-Prymnesium_polylepis.2